MNEHRNMALYYLKASGEFDAAVRKWENKPAADKTWVNIKTFILTGYACKNKQNKLTAKQFKANLIEEQAEATEELVTTLTENHTRQMETLIKSMTDATEGNDAAHQIQCHQSIKPHQTFRRGKEKETR